MSGFCPVLVLGPFCFPCFSSYRITLDDDNGELRFGYKMVWITKLKTGEIQNVQVLENVRPILDSGGYGVRAKSKGDLAYILDAGPAIKLTTTRGETYVFNCERA